jgi:hypothetical protein
VPSFIEAPHSRDPLSITAEMFSYIMTYLQVMPSFLELIFPFGLQHYPRGFHFSAFTAENHLLSTDRALSSPSLRRSGLHIESCYSLKSVERTPDPNNPWSIRQCSVYHRFDLESELSTWIIVKGNSLIQNLIKSETKNELAGQDKSPGLKASLFNCTLTTHAILAAWAGENWQWYINDLEERLQAVTRVAVDIPIQLTQPVPTTPRTKSRGSQPRPAKRQWSLRSISRSMKRSLSGSTVISKATMIAEEKLQTKPAEEVLPVVEEPVEEDFQFSDLQAVQHIQEKASQLMLILRSNCNVLESLGLNYSGAIDQAGSAVAFSSDATYSNATFQQKLNDITKKIRMQQSRVEILLQLISERKTIVSERNPPDTIS